LKDLGGAICSVILRRDQPIQRVIGERLVTAVGCVFVIGDAVDVAIVRAGSRGPIPGMEVIADREDSLAGRIIPSG